MDFHLEPTDRRRKPTARVVWEDIGLEQRLLKLEGQTLAVHDSGAALPFPLLRSLCLPGTGDRIAIESLWFAGGISSGSHQRTATRLWAAPSSGPIFAELTRQGTWFDVQGRSLLEEVTSIRGYAMPADRRLFDLTIRFRASVGAVQFAIAGPGLLQVQLGEMLLPRNGATIANSVGGIGEGAIHAARAHWLRASCSSGGIALFEHPDNPGAPAGWSIVDSGRISVGPFAGWRQYGPVAPEGLPTLAVGEVLTLRYRLFVYGGELSSKRVEQEFASCVFPPRVEIASAQ